MKTFLPTFIAITSLLGLAGCGSGGQSNASLQVSRAFAMTNPNFGGGLIITGKNLSTGKSFSKGLTTTMSMDIVLEKGTWLITAVGWDGGSTSATPFGGNPYCGKIQKDLVNSSEVIDLNVTQQECATSFFAGAHADTTASPQTIKNIGLINTCETFFNGSQVPSDQIIDEIVTGGTGSANFCENIATDMQTKVEGIKIYAMNKDLNASTPILGFSSGCIKASSTAKSQILPAGSTPTNPYQPGNELRLPIAGAQFTIVTFRDNSCTQTIAHFPFKDGLGAGDPTKFDHLLYTYGSMDLKLILPSNDMRRALSPFQAILPFFKRYNSGSHAKFQLEPSSLGSFNFRGVANENSVAVLDNENTCSAVTYTGLVTSATCIDLGDKVQINFTGTTEGAGTFTMNSNTYNVHLDNQTTGVNRFESQKLAMDLIGHDGGYEINRFFNKDDNDDDSYGALSVVRNILSANGAGGLLGITDKNNTFEAECLAKNEDKSLTLFNNDKMAFETYRVVIHNTPVSTPSNFICDNTTMDSADCSSGGETFDKRMLVFDHKFSTVLPAMVFEFNCSSMLGRFEMNQTEIKGIKRDEVKQVVNWNTETVSNLGYQRFERILFVKSFNFNAGTQTWNQKDEIRQTARVVKNGGDDFEAWTFSYMTHKNLSNTFDQSIVYRRLKTGSTTTLNYAADAAAVTNANPTFILTDSAYDAILDRTPSNPDVGTNLFSPYQTFPQGNGGTTASFFPLSSNFTNATQINGNLNFQVRPLGQPAFVNTFGTSFYTSP